MEVLTSPLVVVVVPRNLFRWKPAMAVFLALGLVIVPVLWLVIVVVLWPVMVLVLWLVMVVVVITVLVGAVRLGVRVILPFGVVLVLGSVGLVVISDLVMALYGGS